MVIFRRNLRICFFFSSRRRHTRWPRDWSSDVCSSDYSDGNGLDFWNNSDAIPPARAPKMGTIVHRAVRRTEGGAGQGMLEVTAEWVDHGGTALLREDTRFVFHAADGMRGVDRITTLTALGVPVTFTDEEDGLLGLRVGRTLGQPSNTAEVFTHAKGHAA